MISWPHHTPLKRHREALLLTSVCAAFLLPQPIFLVRELLGSRQGFLYTLLMKHNTNKLLFAVVVLIWAAIVVLMFWPWITNRVSNQPVVLCTLEAKVCPDGSTVGRVPPQCNFASCPSNTTGGTSMEGWVSSHDQKQGIDFQYPQKLSTTYIQPQTWPPTVKLTKAAFSCPAGEHVMNGLPTMNVTRTIDSRTYCVSSSSQGAAGTTYTDYTYATEQNGQLLSISFTLRYPQCLNYDDPQKGECQQERNTFDLDGLIDRLVATVKKSS